MAGNLTSELTFQKLFGIFFIGCLAGVILETFWFFITKGVFESRKGLIYGPFNLVYGFGTVLITLALYNIRSESIWKIFIIGCIIGCAFEYLSSFLQEFLFGTVSWQYDSFKYNINGRVDPLHSFYWGVLSVVWIKLIFPHLSSTLDRIPVDIVMPLTVSLVILMSLDTLISGSAVHRMSERHAGMPADNRIEEMIDKKYPDQRMNRIYTNMEFVGKPLEKKNPFKRNDSIRDSQE